MKVQISSFLAPVILLVAGLHLVLAAPTSSQVSQVKKCNKLLAREQAFCKAFLNGKTPGVIISTSTSILTQSPLTMTVPGPTITLTDSTATSSQSFIVSVTSTATASAAITQTLATVTVASPTVTVRLISSVTLSTTDATVTSTRTSLITESDTRTHSVTSTNTQTITSFSTVTSTSTSTLRGTTITVTSNAPAYTGKSKRNELQPRRNRPRYPGSIVHFSDEIITDACLLLLYGSYLPKTTTTVLTSTQMPSSIVTITGPSSIAHATTTAMVTIPITTVVNVTLTSTNTVLATATTAIPTTITSLSTSTITDHFTKMSNTDTSSTITSYVDITSSFTTTTTSTFVSTSTSTKTIFVVPTVTSYSGFLSFVDSNNQRTFGGQSGSTIVQSNIENNGLILQASSNYLVGPWVPGLVSAVISDTSLNSPVTFNSNGASGTSPLKCTYAGSSDITCTVNSKTVQFYTCANIDSTIYVDVAGSSSCPSGGTVTSLTPYFVSN